MAATRRFLILVYIANMPGFCEKVTDGLRSVSEGKITWEKNNKVTCSKHGACLCLNKDRTIWRCPTCHEGAYIIWLQEV